MRPTCTQDVAIAGAPLYVCQGEEVPLTYVVLASGVAPGPALTFLLGTVGMCLPTVVVSRGALAPRVSYVYVAFWITFVILAGVTFQVMVDGRSPGVWVLDPVAPHRRRRGLGPGLSGRRTRHRRTC